MDNSSSGLTEGSTDGGTDLANGPSLRRTPSSRPISEHPHFDGGGGAAGQPHQIPWVTVIVHKDENGYGMKVSGDKPVYVQSVKEGGAAERAGLHSDDKIIKVNGVNVMQSTHTEVVALIRASTQVVLTVQQRPVHSQPRPASTGMPSPSLHARPHHHHHHHHPAPTRATDHITSPRPANVEKQRQVEGQGVQLMRLMLEKNQRFVEAIRSELAKSNEPKLHEELARAEHRHRALQQQMVNLSMRAEQEAASQQVSALHTHHRTKSSPDPLNMQSASLTEASKRLIASESLSDLTCGPKQVKAASTWDIDSPRGTPPGTPPPPYGGGSGAAISEASETALQVEEDGSTLDEHDIADSGPSQVSPLRTSCGPCLNTSSMLQHQSIISMEEDEMSDQEVGQLQDHGQFKSLSKLLEHNAHLAVFMNYVISNSDPSSLLFYLITDLYKEGNAKEMKKWAYEIHSSFLVPGAPLRLNNVDENVAREIDDVLLKDSEKEDCLRKVFFKARQKAKDDLNEQLADFQQKRTAGLSTIFGPNDAQLDESIHDKTKEIRIVEAILAPIMEKYLDDMEKENVDVRLFTTTSALGTVMGKVFGVRSPQSSALLDRCLTFVSKDKSLKAKLIGKTRKVTVRGHHFVAHQYYTVTYCNHCQLIICGIGPQGYQCSDCSLNIHRHCVKVVEENCPGPLMKKEKGNDRISKLMEKIRPERETRRKPSSHNFGQIDRAKKQSEEDTGGLTDNENGSGDRPIPGGRVGSDRRPDPVRETEERPLQDSNQHNEEEDEYRHEITHPVNKKPSTTSINRSESYKERVHQKRQLRERRKTSDPNLSKTNDVDLDTQGLSYNTNSGSSSNSSLSTRSLDSPSNSLETVTATRTQEVGTVTPTANNSATEWDSDLEAEPVPPDWSRGVDDDVLKNLCAREKKRQEVINELFHTERSHVRNLKVIEHVFYRPIVDSQILPQEHIQLLFSNLYEMLDIHSQFNNLMKVKRRDSPVVGDIAEILLSMFDGPAGEIFQCAAATFCARQQIALELLKERRRKDAKLNSFLTDAEGNSLCRRLQLKDIIPTAMQRLTKYPLLFENLAKYTEEETEELESVQRAVERSKEILNHVNQAVREAEDYQRLADIQKRLEKSAFDKYEHPMVGECKHLDVTKHRLIHEGPLCMRVGNRQKLIDLHVLLLDDAIILLQKQDEKYVLKFYNMTTASGSGPAHSPIIKMSTVLVRPNAVDKKALYLVNTAQNGAQIYDMVATSSSERKTWFRHISEAAEAYKAREGRNRRTEPSGPSASTADGEASEGTQDKTKDSDETDGDPVKEGSNLVPLGGCSSTSQDVESSPVSGSTNDSTSLPSSESAPPTPQVSPSAVPADGMDPLARRMGDGMLSPSPGAQRRRVEPLRLTTEESPLIQPSEVVVSQRPVLTAEPVLTPIEQLRRKDETIRLALAEKQQVIAEILHVPKEEFENIAEIAGEPSLDKEATELVLAAVSQANQLTSILNDSLRVTEEEAVSATSEVVLGGSPRLGRRVDRLPGVPAHKLQSISTSLNAQLTELLKIIKDRDEEREQLRRELQRSRERLHAMHETHRRNQLNAQASPSQSRPDSLVSQDGSYELHHDSEDDTSLHKPAVKGEHDNKVVDVCDLGTHRRSMSEQHDDTGLDVFVDALTGEAERDTEAESALVTKTAEALQAVTTDSLAEEHTFNCDQADP